MTVTSQAGTDLKVDLTGATTAGVWGYATGRAPLPIGRAAWW